MYSAEQVFKAAQAIRPYLPELLAAPQAQQLEEQLAPLLAVPSSSESHHLRLCQLLANDETVQAWVKLYLEENYAAADILKALRVYYPLPGLAHAVESPHYVCPVENCHQDWYRQHRQDAIPHCPIHDLQLVIDS